MKSNRKWRTEAACRAAPQYLFFPDSEASRPGGGAVADQDVADAKSYCKVCPVQAQCLQYALETNQQWGVWGGLMVTERNRLRRKKAS